jgi:two-component system phosphate regulon sensor histidine kinase PhoR
MRKIQSKITLTYILLAVAIVVALGVASSYEIESYFRNRLVSELSTQSEIVLHSLRQDSSATFERFDADIKSLGQLGNFRITLIDGDGKVIDDSEVPADRLSEVENHLSRPEVQEAIRNGIGVGTRHSATVGKDFLYVAKQIRLGMTSGPLKNLGFIRLSIHLEDLQKTIDQIRLKIFVVGMAVLIVVFAVSTLVSKRISRPMVDIARSVEEIRSGNLEKHVSVRSDDEIGRVAQAVNELVEKLKTDIVQLKKLEQVRSEFLGNVSHELRTPIFSLQGFLETLLDGAIDDPNVNRDFLKKASLHASRLDDLLSDLINISQIESGEMKMSFRYFAVNDFLEQVVSEMKPTAVKRKISLELQTMETEVEVLGDKERLKQVMVNLIDNAIKYNGNNGEVVVSSARTDGKVRITVSDTGVGIAKEHLGRIFERFYRVDKERSREAGGTGLGLAIVKHIVEAHGSGVDVQSETGKGSSFSFELKT